MTEAPVLAEPRVAVPSRRRASPPTSEAYLRCVEASRRVRWDLDRDVFRSRRPDPARRFLPDGLSRVDELAFLHPADARFLSQVQGRTYANLFALLERTIGAKTLELSRGYVLGDQAALEALVRFAEEELKHQAMFRRLEQMAATLMPAGYAFVAEPNDVAAGMLARSPWSVLALSLHVELFAQAHYRSSIDADVALCPLWRDVFLFHWKEESQHAVVDELEWRKEDARLCTFGRETAVRDLVALFGELDALVADQASSDASYFATHASRSYTRVEQARLRDLLLRAYRWQFLASGLQEPRFVTLLRSLVTPAQMERIGQAMAPVLAHALGAPEFSPGRGAATNGAPQGTH